MPRAVRRLHRAMEQLLGRPADRRVGAVGGAEVDAAEAAEGEGGADTQDTGARFNSIKKSQKSIDSTKWP